MAAKSSADLDAVKITLFIAPAAYTVFVATVHLYLQPHSFHPQL